MQQGVPNQGRSEEAPGFGSQGAQAYVGYLDARLVAQSR